MDSIVNIPGPGTVDSFIITAPRRLIHTQDKKNKVSNVF
ncbi:hypothetical protein NOR53_3672 [gamma proteobacterium NOR5-3]|nr:hypothetical protein NOR53_3672 [gamma proteobacterium NOR5-3]